MRVRRNLELRREKKSEEQQGMIFLGVVTEISLREVVQDGVETGRPPGRKRRVGSRWAWDQMGLYVM